MIQRILAKLTLPSLAVALICLCLVSRTFSQNSADASINHIQYGPLDRFRASAESVLRKRVLTYWVIGYQLGQGSEPVKYPESSQSFQEFTSDQHYKVLAGGDWAFITPSRFLFEKMTPIGTNVPVIERPWKNISVRVVTTNASGSKAPMTAGELAALERRLLSSVRLVPVGDIDEGVHDEMAVFRLWFQVYIDQLRKDGPRSVVILERQNEAPEARFDVELQQQAFQLDNGRIIYGELGNGGVRLLWDSPLVQIRHMKSLEFRDIDGDGSKEIAVFGSINEGPSEWRTLSIFSLDGQEITRQDCASQRLSWYDNPYGEKACPINGGSEGADVAVDCASLPCVIHGGGNENPDTDDEYRFVKGQYVSQNQAKARSATKSRSEEVVSNAATLNSQGLALMQQRNYERPSRVAYPLRFWQRVGRSALRGAPHSNVIH